MELAMKELQYTIDLAEKYLLRTEKSIALRKLLVTALEEDLQLVLGYAEKPDYVDTDNAALTLRLLAQRVKGQLEGEIHEIVGDIATVVEASTKSDDVKDTPACMEEDNPHDVGSPSFNCIRRSRHFIDKTLFIETIIKRPESVFLITLPPRFGKTVIVDMVSEFFQLDDTVSSSIRGTIFEGTNISSKRYIMERHYKKYPVIRLNFAGNADDFESAFYLLWQKVENCYRGHDYLLNSKILSDADKRRLNIFLESGPKWDKQPQKDLENSLVCIAECLEKHHGEKCIILVDEFDAPVTRCMFDVPFDVLYSIMRLRDTILGNVLKNCVRNVPYKFAILTGVADVICSTTSPLNNLSRFPFLQEETFFPYYGVLQSEFDHLTSDLKEETKLKMKMYYNGYKLGDINLYNTWSIVRSLSMEKIKPFWNVDSNIVRKFSSLLQDGQFSATMKKLIAGEKVLCRSHTILDATDLVRIAACCKHPCQLKDIDIILVFLFQNGYLVKSSDNLMEVPNNEIRDLLMKFCCEYFFFNFNISASEETNCVDSLLELMERIEDENNLEKFRKTFELTCKSFRSDIFNHQILHSLLFLIIMKCPISWNVLGVECPVKDEYRGSNRCDVVLLYNSSLIIIELKYKDTVDCAMEQIEDRNYFEIIRNRKVVEDETKIKHRVCFAVAADANREIKVKLKILDVDQQMCIG